MTSIFLQFLTQKVSLIKR